MNVYGVLSFVLCLHTFSENSKDLIISSVLKIRKQSPRESKQLACTVLPKCENTGLQICNCQSPYNFSLYLIHVQFERDNYNAFAQTKLFDPLQSYLSISLCRQQLAIFSSILIPLTNSKPFSEPYMYLFFQVLISCC